VTEVLSPTQEKDIFNYFRSAGYEVTEISDNIIDIEKKSHNFYMQIILDEDIIISRFSIKTNEFIMDFDNYNAMFKMEAKFSVNQQIELNYQHPFLGANLDIEKFKLAPVSSIVIDLLSQAPIASELIRDVYRITKDIDQLMKEGE